MSTAFVRIHSDQGKSAHGLVGSILILMRRVFPPVVLFHQNPRGIDALARWDALWGQKEILLIWGEEIKVPRFPADGSS